MSGGGGIIIIHGRKAPGNDQADQSVSVSDATAAITWLRTASSSNLGAKAVADALQSAVDFDNS